MNCCMFINNTLFLVLPLIKLIHIITTIQCHQITLCREKEKETFCAYNFATPRI